MKQSFQLNVPGRHRDRLLEASKHTVRKYVARQRRAPLPVGQDYWDFACRFGATEAEAVDVHFGSLTELMNAAAARGDDTFFLSIRGHAVMRRPKVAAQLPATDAAPRVE